MARFGALFPPFIPFGSRNLKLTPVLQRGTDVAVLQYLFDVMVDVMPAEPLGPTISIDGVFGAATDAAVRRVQSYFRLSVDGIVGPQTFFAFGQGVGPNTTYGGPVFGSRNLSPGMTGGDVKIMQNRLNTFRYSLIVGSPADGLFGPKNKAAVQAFQADAIANGDTDMPTDGNVDGSTFDAFWIYTFAGGRGLFQGRNGLDVTFVQTILKNLGFYAGALDGFYGPKTETAVANFQDSEHISSDGVVGPVTFFHIGRHNLNPAPVPFPNIPF
ncbi:MAG TPA: peptidoglycan-binding protein [Bacillota bacterium]|jgi:peptidoglycan hydrolase-like protein with peptidoglycan-binding domain